MSDMQRAKAILLSMLCLVAVAVAAEIFERTREQPSIVENENV